MSNLYLATRIATAAVGWIALAGCASTELRATGDSLSCSQPPSDADVWQIASDSAIFPVDQSTYDQAILMLSTQRLRMIDATSLRELSGARQSGHRGETYYLARAGIRSSEALNSSNYLAIFAGTSFEIHVNDRADRVYIISTHTSSGETRDQNIPVILRTPAPISDIITGFFGVS